MRPISFDEHADFYSGLSETSILAPSRSDSKLVFKEGFDLMVKTFPFLPKQDQEIARLYWLQDLSQEQIRRLLDISQSAVSLRLNLVVDRVRFMIKRPSLNPIRVREDLTKMFPEELFEFAFFYYWEMNQNRVKYYVETSQSGASNKIKQVHQHLDRLKAQNEVDLQSEDPSEDAFEMEYLLGIYYPYFESIRNGETYISFMYKKQDSIRAHSISKDTDFIKTCLMESLTVLQQRQQNETIN